MPFSKGHRPPKEGRGEVLGDTEVGVVVFKVLVEMPEEEETVDPDLGGPVPANDDTLEAVAVELTETTGGLEETAVPGVTLEVGSGD